MIHICVLKCANVCGEAMSRQWSYPGNTVDRTPYGVIAHELGHHVDVCTGISKGKYSSEYGKSIMDATGEKPISSYCPNPGEWFAEMFRVFFTNPNLLKQLRPRTWECLSSKFNTVESRHWREVLADAPARVIKALENKGAK